jgi:hypothetical protein
VAFLHAPIGDEGMARHLIYTSAVMPHMPIQKVTIQNCGCVKKAEVNLTRLHALIGPNDSGKSTILIATHSPLVINELKPNEVTVVTRDDSGTHCKPIGETPGFADRSKVYALGELWLSYANGKDEAPLLKGSARE